jgi:type IV pilus assembly protein PilO
MAEFSLTKLPWYGQIGAFVLLAIGSCGAFYWYYELPTQAEMQVRRDQLKSLQGDINKGQATARQLPQFRADVSDLEARLESLRAVLPEEKDAADLLHRMQIAASQANLEIKSFKPNPVVTKQLHAEWPITLELSGTYHNLAIFFDKVGKLPRIVNITNVDIRAVSTPTDGGPTIDATCIATTFVLLDKPQPAKPGAKPASGATAAAPAKGA